MLRSFSLLLLVAVVSPVSADPPHPQPCAPDAANQVCPWGGMLRVYGMTCHTIEKEKACSKKVKYGNPCTGLIEIMETTKSPDTFLMAVTALPALGDKGCRALPAVVRNAERLGLLKGLVNGPSTPAHRALLSYVQQVGITDVPPPPVPPPAPPAAYYGYPVPATTCTPAQMVPPPPADLPPPQVCPAPGPQQTEAAPERLAPPREVSRQNVTPY
jgi:hypothetical protein